MSRSIGDTRLHGYGISHAAEINFFERALNEGEEAFIVVASDGLECLSAEEIGGTIKDGMLLSEATLNLAFKARNTRMNFDNISVVIFQPGASAAVFDG